MVHILVTHIATSRPFTRQLHLLPKPT